ncbi:MAG: hypothetical protein IT223_05610 [Crocinitomicaceae bacterium]|nr:hypothetical protein [Crocinitomicaceae bacterium]
MKIIFTSAVLFFVLVFPTPGQVSPQIGYYESGKLQYENYRINENDTTCRNREWYEDESLLSDQRRSGDTCITTYYYAGGKTESTTHEIPAHDVITGNLLGYRVVKQINYCENGRITDYRNDLQKGKKPFSIVNCNGAVLVKGTIIDDFDHKTGDWLYVWENMGKKMEGSFFETDNIEETNIRVGKWTYWDMSGKVIREQWYGDNGQLIREEKY